MQINDRDELQNDCDKKTVEALAIIHPVLIFFLPYVVISFVCFFYISIFIGLLFILLTIIFLVFVIVFEFLYERKSGTSAINLIKQEEEFNSVEPHHAIIIAHKMEKKNGSFPIKDYAGGVDIVIMALRRHNPPLPYHIYDIDTIHEGVEVIKNPNTKWLWIFGHGQRNKLRFSDGFLCYFLLKNIPKKEFIGQYHCNSPLGNSLADYLNPPVRDVTRFFRFPSTMEFSVNRKLIELSVCQNPY